MKRLDQKGQGMTEYILIVALIAVAVIGVVKLFGSKVKTGFNQAATSVGTALDNSKTSSTDSTGNKIP